jgi:hypothetical protein
VAIEGFYNIAQVTRTSLRTGLRFGQEGWDVVGQRAAITKVNATLPITRYPVIGQFFSEIADFATPSNGEAAPPVRKTPAPSSVFTHLQPIPQTIWTIPHQMDHYPLVTVIVNQELVEPDVYYPNTTTVTIQFAEPTTGIAVMV